MKKQFDACIYLYQGSAVKTLTDHTIVSNDLMKVFPAGEELLMIQRVEMDGIEAFAVQTFNLFVEKRYGKSGKVVVVVVAVILVSLSKGLWDGSRECGDLVPCLVAVYGQEVEERRSFACGGVSGGGRFPSSR